MPKQRYSTEGIIVTTLGVVLCLLLAVTTFFQLIG